MRKISFSLLCWICMTQSVAAQDSTNLMATLESGMQKPDYTIATFKSTRLITGHSVETLGKGVLDVRILHRFAPLNRGLYDFFGLDFASMRMGFDYGFSDRIMAGVGRSNWQKTLDGYVKVKLLRQAEGNGSPVTISFLSAIATRTDKLKLDTSGNRIKPGFGDRSSFTQQLLIARKFSSRLSLQLMPTYIVSHNKIDSINTYTLDKNNILSGNQRKGTFAMGIGGRMKLSKRVSLNAEYYYQLESQRAPRRYNSLAFGFDIETGGHVFQLHFTNSNGMTEKAYISDTDDRWEKGAIRFGFNLSRVFQVGKRR